MADSYGRLTYAFDGGFLSGAHPPPDTPPTSDDVDEYSDSENTDSSSIREEESKSKNRLWSDLSSSIRMFSNSYLKMEMAELEMMKAREASRIEAERRRMESETEMTQMMLNTQLEMASFLGRNSRKRKREGKEVEDDDSTTTERNLEMRSSNADKLHSDSRGSTCVVSLKSSGNEAGEGSEPSVAWVTSMQSVPLNVIHGRVATPPHNNQRNLCVFKVSICVS